MRNLQRLGSLSNSLFIVLLMGSTGPFFAQSDFRPGYFIFGPGDTTRALVNFAKTDVCEFKIQNEKKQLSATEIIGFGFDNDRYYSATVLAGQFLEVIVDGYLSLYKSDKSFFIKKVKDTLIRLDSGKSEVEGSQSPSTNIQWKGVLKFILKDCDGINGDIDLMRFSETDFLKLTAAYNKCKNENYVEYKSNNPGLKISPGIGFGVGYSNFGLRNGETVILIPTKFNSTDPIPILLLNFYSPKISNKISIQAEIQWKRLLTNSSIEGQEAIAFVNRETQLNISFLSLPVYFKYSLPMDKKTMAFYFGFLYDKLLSQKTKVLTTENRDGTITNSELIDPYDFNLPQFGLSTGMSYGISLKKLSLSTHLRYNLQGLTADSMLKKDGKFDFEFRRANVLNRLSLAFAVQLQ